MEDTEITHANAAGLVGGYSLCGGDGDIVAEEKFVSCEACLTIIHKQIAWSVRRS